MDQSEYVFRIADVVLKRVLFTRLHATSWKHNDIENTPSKQKN